MRRFIIATTLAAALAPLAAPQASAAPGIVTPRLVTHTLRCAIYKDSLQIDNSMNKNMPKGTKIAIVVMVDRPVKMSRSLTITTSRELFVGSRIWTGAPSGATSCKATATVMADNYRR